MGIKEREKANKKGKGAEAAVWCSLAEPPVAVKWQGSAWL